MRCLGLDVGFGASVIRDHVKISWLENLVSVLQGVWVQKGVCKLHMIDMNIFNEYVMMHGMV